MELLLNSDISVLITYNKLSINYYYVNNGSNILMDLERISLKNSPQIFLILS